MTWSVSARPLRAWVRCTHVQPAHLVDGRSESLYRLELPSNILQTQAEAWHEFPFLSLTVETKVSFSLGRGAKGDFIACRLRGRRYGS